MNWNGIVSLFIACIELLLLINLLSFAEKNRFNILAIILVALLFLYQSAEALICTFGYDDPFIRLHGFCNYKLSAAARSNVS
jgi:hypothetical protein